MFLFNKSDGAFILLFYIWVGFCFDVKLCICLNFAILYKYCILLSDIILSKFFYVLYDIVWFLCKNKPKICDFMFLGIIA